MKILKWILGIITAIAGIFAMFAGGQKRAVIKKKIKENDKAIKQKSKEIENIKTGSAAMRASARSKQKTIDEMKKAKENFKPKDVGADDAAEFLKKYAKKKGKK